MEKMEKNKSATRKEKKEKRRRKEEIQKYQLTTRFFLSLHFSCKQGQHLSCMISFLGIRHPTKYWGCQQPLLNFSKRPFHERSISFSFRHLELPLQPTFRFRSTVNGDGSLIWRRAWEEQKGERERERETKRQWIIVSVLNMVSGTRTTQAQADQ